MTLELSDQLVIGINLDRDLAMVLFFQFGSAKSMINGVSTSKLPL
jgi:hypothetical protein